MADLIYTDIMQEIEDITDEQLLNGDGVGANPTGLLSQVGGYVLTSITGVPNANNADALRAAYAQLRSLNYRPNIIFVNPIDAGKMDLEKGTNGHYVLPLFMSQDGTTLKSIRIEETNEIEPGDFLMGDMSRYKIRIYEELRIELGWVNDDFQKNVKTVIGEKRLYNFLSQKHSGAFVHDTYAVVKTAIA